MIDLASTKEIVKLLLIGAIIVAGMRAAEWLIPEPESRVLICFPSDTEKFRGCRSLADMIDKIEATQ